jgi:hypothetical protein
VDELETLRGLAVPRDSPLIGRLARRFAPIWGFAAYGALYSVVPLTLAVVAMFLIALSLSRILHNPEGHLLPPWAQVVVSGGALLVFALSYAPIVLWARSRRAALRRLFRNGRFAQAAVMRVVVVPVRSITVTRAVLAFQTEAGPRQIAASVEGEPVELVPGALIPVLVEPGSVYSAAFVAGRAVPAR